MAIVNHVLAACLPEVSQTVLLSLGAQEITNHGDIYDFSQLEETVLCVENTVCTFFFQFLSFPLVLEKNALVERTQIFFLEPYFSKEEKIF